MRREAEHLELKVKQDELRKKAQKYTEAHAENAQIDEQMLALQNRIRYLMDQEALADKNIEDARKKKDEIVSLRAERAAHMSDDYERYLAEYLAAHKHAPDAGTEAQLEAAQASAAARVAADEEAAAQVAVAALRGKPAAQPRPAAARATAASGAAVDASDSTSSMPAALRALRKPPKAAAGPGGANPAMPRSSRAPTVPAPSAGGEKPALKRTTSASSRGSGKASGASSRRSSAGSSRGSKGEKAGGAYRAPPPGSAKAASASAAAKKGKVGPRKSAPGAPPATPGTPGPWSPPEHLANMSFSEALAMLRTFCLDMQWEDDKDTGPLVSSVIASHAAAGSGAAEGLVAGGLDRVAERWGGEENPLEDALAEARGLGEASLQRLREHQQDAPLHASHVARVLDVGGAGAWG
ncbi:unnamed protein product [Pedinophyceae sp. YPF-701]|nr:unnamed protein product [Pedinophyceae sp. YPF-701]